METSEHNALSPRPNFWTRNKGRILGTTAAVLATVVVLQRIGLREHDKFLVEKELFDEYYTPDESD